MEINPSGADRISIRNDLASEFRNTDPQRALQYLEESEELIDLDEHPWLYAQYLDHYGSILMVTGRQAQADSVLNNAYQLFVRLDDKIEAGKTAHSTSPVSF